MNVLYWISTFDAIIGVSVLLCIFGVVALVSIIVCNVLNKELDETSIYDRRAIVQNNYIIKIARPFLYVGIIALFVAVFCPSTKQGFLIYGVGNTIDYFKCNDKAQQLPDKAI